MKEFNNLDLGWYFCLVRITHCVNERKHIFSIEDRIEVRKLELNISNKKYFAPKHVDEEIIQIQKITQSCNFLEKKETIAHD